MSDHPPVALIHGLGSSFEHGWVRPGWTALLEDEGREVLPVLLPGHPGAEDVAAHTPHEAVAAVAAQLPATEVDLIGFSAGAIAALHLLARRHPVGRAVLLGTGEKQLQPMPDAEGFADSLAAGGEGMWRRVLARSGASPAGVAAFARLRLRAPRPESLRDIAVPVLFVTGTRDHVGRPESLPAALPDARVVMVADADHNGLPSDPRAISAALQFLTA